MNNFKKQFNKGVLELGILKLLNDKDHYGYSMMQDINTLTDNAIEMKDGTLYPILYRLEDQKKIKSYWKTSSVGQSKPRKYYTLTDKGRKVFLEMLEDYHIISNAFKKLLDS